MVQLFQGAAAEAFKRDLFIPYKPFVRRGTMVPIRFRRWWVAALWGWRHEAAKYSSIFVGHTIL